MHEKVLQYVRGRKLLGAGDRVAVALSGGADSVALLRVLLELRTEMGIVLAAAHFNHGLRGEQAAADEAFVVELTKECGLECFVGRGDVRSHASASRLSVESAARELRYRFFDEIARDQRLDCIATAHTLDDQAETVLLKFLRGAGTKGLAGIYPLVMADAPGATGMPRAKIVRPLLCVSREEIESYLSSIGQSWREDESNLDRRFLRNRVRHELLPLLERDFNPNIREALNALAEIALGEEEYWRGQVNRELTARLLNDRLDLAGFVELPRAVQRRLLKGFAEQQGVTLHFEHIERLRSLASREGSRTELPEGLVAVNSGQVLVFRQPASGTPLSYRLELPIPGKVYIAELGLVVRAYVVEAEFARESASGDLLSLDLVGTDLIIRNWVPGDRFWPAHSRSKEKLKRLFLEKNIPAAARPSWPVALCEDQIVWVQGFPVANRFRWSGVGEAVRIEAVAE